MNSGGIDQIIWCALAIASEEDEPRDRELGPIHPIKYVYLADLDHARGHEGETHTGLWTGTLARDGELHDTREFKTTGTSGICQRMSGPKSIN